MGIMEPTQPHTSGCPDDDMLTGPGLFVEVDDRLGRFEYGVEVIRWQMVLVS